MTRTALVVLVAFLATFLYCRAPSVRKVVGNTLLSPEEGWLSFDGVRFEAEWGPRVEHRGHARLFERAKYKSAPFFTHHTAFTTGDFADPSFVTITNRGGSFSWTAKTQPQGTLVVLHIVPRDSEVARKLGRIDDGDLVEFAGREETDGYVKAANGNFLRAGHSNHKFLLVESVTPLDP